MTSTFRAKTEMTMKHQLAVLDLPTTFVPNLPKQDGDLHDILNRMLAKLNEWATVVAPDAIEEYKEWIKPFHTAALDSIAKGHQTKPTMPDPAPDGWEEEYRQATRDGLAISTCDKSNGFVYMCSCLPPAMLEMQVDSQLGPHAHIRLLPNGSVRWSKDRPNKKDSRHFPVNKVQHLIRYLLKNDFVSACGIVWKSSTGVPMGGNAASRISSLTAYFAEREPLAQIKRDIAGAQFFRYADDIYYTFDEFTFNLYFAGAYAAAGFTLEHERGKGITRAINYLETTIHLPRPMDVDQDAWTTHYSKKQELFPQDRSLPHRGSASSVSGQKQQLANLRPQQI
eukprot:gene2729-2199_t